MDNSSTSKQHQLIQVNAAKNLPVMMEFVGMSDAEISEASEVHKTGHAVVMPLQTLAQSLNYCEQWSDGSLTNVSMKGGSYQLTTVKTDHHLVLDFMGDDADLHALVRQIYHHAYQAAEQHGFKHLIRVWNYIDRINQSEGDIERYQTFCVARHQALEELNQLSAPNPAATAIGGHAGVNGFTFLYSQHIGQVVENKRQVSAWQYPRQYAPKQPRFSRAMMYGDALLCSGTASVVGHETIHLDDLGAQFDECLNNIQALLDESGVEVPINEGVYRFYLRDKALLNQVQAKTQSYGISDYIVLEGDICRENLLIECEAVFQSA